MNLTRELKGQKKFGKYLPSYTRGSYKKEPRTCKICGKVFNGTKKAIYCSNACRIKGSRNGRKAKH